MSLFVRPVSASDLTQLQLGIEFFTDTNEANVEADLITDPPGTPTVYSYASQLLARNISLSQVAMAVDSLMFGETDNIGELTKLATQFLPAQVGVAVGAGLNPTVYAAEALGLAGHGARRKRPVRVQLGRALGAALRHARAVELAGSGRGRKLAGRAGGERRKHHAAGSAVAAGACGSSSRHRHAWRHGAAVAAIAAGGYAGCL